METVKPTIGIAGLGIMGHAIASRLLDAGYALFVYNRTPSRTEPLVGRGATRVSCPRELGDRCAITIVMVSDDEALWAVVNGEEGILKSTAVRDKFIVNMSTVSPEATERIAQACATHGATFVDSPVSGSKPQAESGALILLTSGGREGIDAIEPVLQAIGKRIVYAGDVGNGTRLKLAVNLVLAHLAGALAEGTTFCEAVDLDARLLLEVLEHAPALSAGYFQGKGPKTLQEDWSPQFPLKHMLKDVRLAQRSSGRSLPVSDAIEQLLSKAADLGHANDDVSAIVTGL